MGKLIKQLHPISVIVFLVGIALAVVGIVLTIVFSTQNCSPPPVAEQQCQASLFSIRTGIQPTVATWNSALSNPNSQIFKDTSQAVATALQQSLQPVANGGSQQSQVFSQLDQSSSNTVEIVINRFEKATDGSNNLIAYASGAIATTDMKTVPNSNTIQTQLQKSTDVTDPPVASPTANQDPLQYCNSTDISVIVCPITSTVATSIVSCPVVTTTVPCICSTIPSTLVTQSATSTSINPTTSTSPTTTLKTVSSTTAAEKTSTVSTSLSNAPTTVVTKSSTSISPTTTILTESPTTAHFPTSLISSTQWTTTAPMSSVTTTLQPSTSIASSTISNPTTAASTTSVPQPSSTISGTSTAGSTAVGSVETTTAEGITSYTTIGELPSTSTGGSTTYTTTSVSQSSSRGGYTATPPTSTESSQQPSTIPSTTITTQSQLATTSVLASSSAALTTTSQPTTSSCASGETAFSGDIAIVFDSTYTSAFSSTSQAMLDFILNHLLTYQNYDFTSLTRLLLVQYPNTEQLTPGQFNYQSDLKVWVSSYFQALGLLEERSPDEFSLPKINDGLQYIQTSVREERRPSAIIIIGMNDSLVAEAVSTAKSLQENYEIFTIAFLDSGEYNLLASSSQNTYTVLDPTNISQADSVANSIGNVLYSQSSACILGSSTVRPQRSTTPISSPKTTAPVTTTAPCPYRFYNLNLAIVWEASVFTGNLTSTDISNQYLQTNFLPRVMSNLLKDPDMEWTNDFTNLGIFPFPNTSTRVQAAGNFSTLAKSTVANTLLTTTTLLSQSYYASSIVDGLNYAQSQFNSLTNSKPNVLILFANSGNGTEAAEQAAKNLQAAPLNTLMFTVSVNSNGDFAIDDLASNPTYHGHLTRSTGDLLTQAITKVLDKIPNASTCCVIPNCASTGEDLSFFDSHHFPALF